ncbi:MAG TPA: transcriptional activator NhaR [Rhodocyclaceae bacterium]|nr:transcriptional activator NhaR [Rhodocyclaceae bacterium]
MQPLNYRHLLYFWVVAKEGSVTRAAQRLGVTVQTISGQLGQLERDVGRALFAQQGRRLVLTESGRLALGYADQIFQLGEQLQDALQVRTDDRAIRLTMGIADAVPKLVAYRLIECALRLPQTVRLVCHEGKFEAMLSELALHKLDAVLADRPVGSGVNLRVFHHLLGESEVAVFAAPDLAERCRDAFPACLGVEPMLLPTRNCAIRTRIEAWFETRGLRPRLAAEFDDTALLKTFGRSGLGLFPAPAALAEDLRAQYGAVPVGTLDGVREQFYVISNERRITHPAVEAMRAATVKTIFPPSDR